MHKKASLPGVINDALGYDAVALGHYTGRYIVGVIFKGHRLAAVGFVVRRLGHGAGCLEIKAAALCAAVWPMRPKVRARRGEREAADSGEFGGGGVAEEGGQRPRNATRETHVRGAAVETL